MRWHHDVMLLRTIRAYCSKRRVVPPVLFRTNYYSIEILHGVTAIILTYHPHHAKLQVLPIIIIIIFFVYYYDYDYFYFFIFFVGGGGGGHPHLLVLVVVFTDYKTFHLFALFSMLNPNQDTWILQKNVLWCISCPALQLLKYALLCTYMTHHCVYYLFSYYIVIMFYAKYDFIFDHEF